MADTLNFELVSPERLLMSGDVSSVKVPGSEWDFVVLPDHAPFMTTLRPGIIEIDSADGEQKFFVNGGFADVSPNGLILLAEFAADCATFKGEAVADELKKAEAHLETVTGDEAKRQANMLVACLNDLA